MLVVNVAVRQLGSIFSNSTWQHSMMVLDSSVISVNTKALHNSILNHTWHPSMATFGKITLLAKYTLEKYILGKYIPINLDLLF